MSEEVINSMIKVIGEIIILKQKNRIVKKKRVGQKMDSKKI